MFGWLFPARCPVEPDRKLWLESGLNWLGGQFGAQRMLQRPIVLPTPEFFPDPYDGSREAATAIFDHVCQYMEVDRSHVVLDWFVNERDTIPQHLQSGRTDGAGGYYYNAGLGFIVIAIDEKQLRDPLSLIAVMAHELGHVHLLGDKRISAECPDHEPLTDLLTVLYGLGIFSANAVLTENHWSDGQYAGWSVGRQGYLDGPDYGYAMAILSRAHGEAKPAWASHLRLDVRSVYKRGLRFLCATEQSPFPGVAPSGFALPPEDDVPWTHPRLATDDWDEDDHLPPWMRKPAR